MLLLNDKGRFLTDKEFIRQSGNFGLLAAYIISWVLSTKRNWHWVNSVIVFLLAFTLYNLGYWGWNFLHVIFQAPGKLFPKNSIGEYLTNGLILLAIGVVILFSKGLMRYIDKHPSSVIKNGNKADRKAAKTKLAQ
jgi:predicted permease